MASNQYCVPVRPGVSRAPVILPIIFAILAFGLLAPATGWASPTGEAPEALIDQFHGHLIGAMKRSRDLNARARFEQLSKPVETTFLTDLTARQAAGRRAWKSASDGDRSAYLDAFRHWTVSSYASQFKNFGGHAFSPGAAKPGPKPGTTLVESVFSVPGEDAVTFTYLMIDDGGNWGVYDVLVRRGTTTVSQLAKYISEFKSTAGNGLPALTAVLTEKSALLLAE